MDVVNKLLGETQSVNESHTKLILLAMSTEEYML